MDISAHNISELETINYDLQERYFLLSLVAEYVAQADCTDWDSPAFSIAMNSLHDCIHVLSDSVDDVSLFYRCVAENKDMNPD